MANEAFLQAQAPMFLVLALERGRSTSSEGLQGKTPLERGGFQRHPFLPSRGTGTLPGEGEEVGQLGLDLPFSQLATREVSCGRESKPASPDRGISS